MVSSNAHASLMEISETCHSWQTFKIILCGHMDMAKGEDKISSFPHVQLRVFVCILHEKRTKTLSCSHSKSLQLLRRFLQKFWPSGKFSSALELSSQLRAFKSLYFLILEPTISSSALWVFKNFAWTSVSLWLNFEQKTYVFYRFVVSVFPSMWKLPVEVVEDWCPPVCSFCWPSSIIMHKCINVNEVANVYIFHVSDWPW